MSKKVIETIYGKYSKFEIVKTSGMFSSKFYVYKDGKPYRGEYSSLRAAVEAAKSEG